MLKVDLGEAQIWMHVAADLHLQSADDSLAGANYPQTNQLNVAHVCAGFAFELLFKVLARAGGGDPPAVHRPSEAFETIKQLPDDRLVDSIGKIFSQHGWRDTEELLTFLDDLCDTNRKYWGLPRSGMGGRHAEFGVGGRKAGDALRKMHQDLSRLALRSIDANTGVMEDWGGIYAIAKEE